MGYDGGTPKHIDVSELVTWAEDDDNREDDPETCEAIDALADDISDGQLIHEDAFEEHAQQLADELGFDTDSWPATCVDWERAARDLCMDYTAFEFLGATYYTRD
jgi:hypothetical protein